MDINKNEFIKCFENLFLMLINRKWITIEEKNKYFNDIQNNIFQNKFELINLSLNVKNNIIIHISNDKSILKKKKELDVLSNLKNQMIILLNNTALFKSNDDNLGFPNLEIWKISDLQYDLMSLKIVPKQKIVIFENKEDRDLFFEQYNVEPEQMPVMYNTDPIVKYLNAHNNDIISCERPEGIYYRIVVPKL